MLENLVNAMQRVRQPMPRLNVNQLMAVQPLAQPASLIFYMRYRYSENRGSRIAKPFVDKVDWRTEGF